MSPILQKIFMLQRHQLIRWGTLYCYAALAGGILVIVTGILFAVSTSAKIDRLESKSREFQAQGKQITQSLDSIEKLRSVSLENSEYFEKMETACLQTVRLLIWVVFTLCFLMGIVAMSYGPLAIRAKELALETDKDIREK